MDRLIAQTKKLSYARVCVEIEAKKLKPHRIPIRCGDEILEVRVEYQWVLAMCSKCMTYGHGWENCEKEDVIVNVVPEKGSDFEEEEQEWEIAKRKGKKKVGVIREENKSGDKLLIGGGDRGEENDEKNIGSSGGKKGKGEGRGESVGLNDDVGFISERGQTSGKDK